MKKFILPKLAVLATVFTVILAGCTNTDNKDKKPETKPAGEPAAPATVDVTDIQGTVTVPVNPKKIVALDNRTFETLSDWGIKLEAAPKDVMPADSPYVKDASVQNIGTHRDPNLEVIAAVEPDLVIVGQRFASFYEDIKKLVPNAAVINLNVDVSTEAATPGQNLIDGLKNSTMILGQIFDKDTEAKKLVADFDKAIEDAKSAYNGTDTMISVVVSGGEIGFSAPRSGRVWGPMYEIFGWVSALNVDGSSSDHTGDNISVEAIAQSNPDWIFVLDRDAALSTVKDAVPARDVINNSPALQNIKAITQDRIIYAPNDTYTNESLQTYVELFNTLASTLSK